MRASGIGPASPPISILTLALGIGANAAVFSVVTSRVVDAASIRQPDRLVQIWETNPPMNWMHAVVAPANFLDWQASNRSFDSLGVPTSGPTQGAGSTIRR